MMGLLVICISWQVLSRYVLTQPSTQTDELSRFLLIWLVLLGAAVCTSGRRHLAIDLLQNALPSHGRRILEVYSETMIATFAAGVMMLGGYRIVQTSASMGEISPALQMPMSYVYAALPISGTLILAFCIFNLIETLFGMVPATNTPAPYQEDSI